MEHVVKIYRISLGTEHDYKYNNYNFVCQIINHLLSVCNQLLNKIFEMNDNYSYNN